MLRLSRNMQIYALKTRASFSLRDTESSNEEKSVSMADEKTEMRGHLF